MRGTSCSQTTFVHWNSCHLLLAVAVAVVVAAAGNLQLAAYPDFGSDRSLAHSGSTVAVDSPFPFQLAISLASAETSGVDADAPCLENESANGTGDASGVEDASVAASYAPAAEGVILEVADTLLVLQAPPAHACSSSAKAGAASQIPSHSPVLQLPPLLRVRC